jgi:DNA-binding SARP family transcriptional activator
LEIRILGPIEVWDNGEPLPLGGTKQRAVLAMLALNVNHVVSYDHLVDGLWGSQASERASNAVQVYISRLRKILGQDRDDRPGGSNILLQRRNPGYVLEVDHEGFDLGRFERLARIGTDSLVRAPRAAAATLRQALDLWRGPALAEFAGQPFAGTEIQRLEERHLAVLLARVEADLVLGRHAELLAELETLAAGHPLDEQLHYQWILSLYRSGRQADALDAYRKIRHTLIEELGVDPGRPLQGLEEAVLNQDPRLDWSPPLVQGGDSPLVSDVRTVVAEGKKPVEPIRSLPIIWNLPARNPHFTGRAGMLDEVHDRLRGGEQALIVQALYGLGGVGKTQLALEYAHRFAGEYSIIWWIDAEQPVLLPEQFARLARMLDLPIRGSVQDAVQQVKTELAHRANWLLIFDNAERVEDVAAYRPAGSGHMLLTSRFPGWGALGGRLQVDVLERAETVTLLRSRVPAMTDALANELAAELGDLPLAVAQAVAYLEQSGLTPDDYLRQFSTRRSALLARGDVLDYQGRVDTAWDLSLERLTSVNSASLELMKVSAFLAPEPIPISLFTARPDVLGELGSDHDPADLVSDAVGDAVRFSLVRRLRDGFQVHRLVQAVIRKKLSAPELAATTARVADLLSAAHPGAPSDPARWSTYAGLVPHVLAVGAICDEREATRRLVIDTVAYLNLNSDNRASRRIAAEYLDRWRPALGPDHPDTLVLAAHLMLALFWMGDAAQARTLGLDILPRARRTLGPDHPGTLRIAGYLVMAQAWLGDADDARILAHDTLTRVSRTLNPQDPDVLRMNTYLALVLAWVGDRAARPLAREILDQARLVLGPDHPTTMFAAVDLSLGLLETGDTGQIRALSEDTLQRAEAGLGPRHLLTLGSAALLAQALTWDGEIDRANKLGREYLDSTKYHLGPDHLISLIAFAAVASARVGSVHTGAEPLVMSDLAATHRALGRDHPISLITAAAVSTSMAEHGVDGAAELAADTLERAEQLLGPDHPLTIGLVARVK